MGRLVSEVQGIRGATFNYGTDGYLSSLVDALGKTTTYGRDAMGAATSEARADGATTLLSFDGDGNVTSLTPPGKPEHDMGFDGVELLASYTPPAVASVVNPATTYTYDAARRLTLTTLPDGRTIHRLYDPEGRLSETDLGAGEGSVSLTYDSAPATGHVHTMTGPDPVTVTYARDGSLLTSTTWSGAISGAVSWSYDADLRLASETAGGVAVSYGYDNDDLLTTAGPATITRSPADGLMTALTVGNLAESFDYTQVEGTTPRKYGEVVHRSVAVSGGATLYDLALQRDALGRIVQRTEVLNGTTRVYEYGYDLQDRLSTVSLGGDVVATYTYDQSGNRTSEDGSLILATYDAQNRLHTYSGTTYVYEPNGTRQSEASFGVTKSYTHDAKGTLRGVQLGVATVSYAVDGAARRVVRKTNGLITNQWLYEDGLRIGAELDENGGIVWRFIYAGDDRVPNVALDSDGNAYRIVSDQVGSFRLLLRVADGVVVQRMRHNAWGRIEEDFVADGYKRLPFGFAGGLYDADTGLVHFGAREYDPAVGAWVERDPARFAGRDHNLYRYAGADPVNRYDARGLGSDLPLDCRAGCEESVDLTPCKECKPPPPPGCQPPAPDPHYCENFCNAFTALLAYCRTLPSCYDDAPLPPLPELPRLPYENCEVPFVDCWCEHGICVRL